MTFAKTRHQKAWARTIARTGLHAFAQDAYRRQVRRGARSGRIAWLRALEDAAVIEPWVFVATSGSGADACDIEYEVVDPQSGAPLYVAGEAWSQFVDEAARLVEGAS